MTKCILKLIRLLVSAPRERISDQTKGLGHNAKGAAESTEGSGQRSLQGIYSKNNASYNVA